MNKSELRKTARKLKKSLDFNEISKAVCKNIITLEEYKKSDSVMLYHALADEIPLEALMNTSEKRFSFPAVEGDYIIPREHTSSEKIGKFGILEPTGRVLLKQEIDLVVVPGVMFGPDMSRIGRGKGFYDRFLSDFNGIKLGVCPDLLLSDSVFSEKYDIKMDIIVTEKQIIKVD